MFKIKNDFCRRNIARNIRFTDPLLKQLKETAQQYNISLSLLVGGAVNTRWRIWKTPRTVSKQRNVLTKETKKMTEFVGRLAPLNT